jgi:pimeloyl-ACP methyl ester carboxylesterase
MRDDAPDDMAFSKALIDYMIENYPVDPGRVYLSGFSNGAAQAQAMALVHPECVAAICHIDSNWPGMRDGPSEVDWHNVRPFAVGMALKSVYDYRIPVWYTYGSREPSYPVYRGSTQQHQYDFWKLYNNITIKPTPERDNPDPCGCGVPGDLYELTKPSLRHPAHAYDVQRFFSNDSEPENYYNYIMMRDKGHDVAEMDPALGWRMCVSSAVTPTAAWSGFKP